MRLGLGVLITARSGGLGEDFAEGEGRGVSTAFALAAGVGSSFAESSGASGGIASAVAETVTFGGGAGSSDGVAVITAIAESTAESSGASSGVATSVAVGTTTGGGVQEGAGSSTSVATASAAGEGVSITIDTATYTRGAAGVAPDLATTVSDTGTTAANYTLFWATRSTGTPLSKSNIENGTGDALDNGTVVAAALADLDGSLDLSTSLASGAIDLFIRDNDGIESAVVSETGVTYDAVAPAYSSSVVENAAPSNLVITLTKATYEAGTLAPADFTLGGTYAGSISTATLTNTTTITLGLSTPVANGDTLTVALTDGAVLVGVDAEAVATWTAENVTNNVAASAGITADHQGIYEIGTAAFGGTASTSVDIGAADAGRDIFVGFYHDTDSGGVPTSVTVNGVTLTEITQNANWEHLSGGITYSTRWFRGTVASGSGSQTLQYTGSTGEVYQPLVSVWRVLGASATLTDTEGVSGDGTTATTPAFSTAANGVTIGMIGLRFTDGLAFTGATQQGSTVQYTDNTIRNLAAFRETGNSAGTDTVSATLNISGTRTLSVLSLAEA